MINTLRDDRLKIIHYFNELNNAVTATKFTKVSDTELNDLVKEYLIDLNILLLSSDSVQFLEIQKEIECFNDTIKDQFEEFEPQWQTKLESIIIRQKDTEQALKVIFTIALLEQKQRGVILNDFISFIPKLDSTNSIIESNKDLALEINEFAKSRNLEIPDWFFSAIERKEIIKILSSNDIINIYNSLVEKQGSISEVIQNLEKIISSIAIIKEDINNYIDPILRQLLLVLKNLELKYSKRQHVITEQLLININHQLTISYNELEKENTDIATIDRAVKILRYYSILNLFIFWFDHNYFIDKLDLEEYIKHNLYLKEHLENQLLLYDKKIKSLVQYLEIKHSYLLKKILKKKHPSETKNDRIILHHNDVLRLSEFQSILENYEPVCLTEYNGINFVQLKKHIDSLKEISHCESPVNSIKKTYTDFVKLNDVFRNTTLYYNIYCYDVISNYIYFNWFSMNLKLLENDINSVVAETENIAEKLNELDNLYNKANQLIENSKIYNYYPYRRYTEFIIDELFSIKNLDQDTFDKYYAIAEELLNKFEIHLEWCMSFNFIQFQYPNNQSLLIRKNSDFHIFIASGASEPIDFRKELNILNKLKAKFTNIKEVRNLNSEIINHKKSIDDYATKSLALDESKKKIEAEYEIFNKNIDLIAKKLKDTEQMASDTNKEALETKQKLKDSEKNSIQILSIFSAIVLFTTGSISFFKDNVVTPAQSFAFILGYGYVLVLFVIILHYVFYYRHSDDEILQKNNKTLLRYLLIGLLAIVSFIIINTEPFFSWLKSLF